MVCIAVPLFRRGVACYARNSWQRHAMVINTTNTPMRLTAQGVACCAPTKTMNVAVCPECPSWWAFVVIGILPHIAPTGPSALRTVPMCTLCVHFVYTSFCGLDTYLSI